LGDHGDTREQASGGYVMPGSFVLLQQAYNCPYNNSIDSSSEGARTT